MIKKIKTILFIFLVTFSFANISNTASAALEVDFNYSVNWKSNSDSSAIKNWMINAIDDKIILEKKSDTEIWSFFKFVKNQVYSIVWIIAIAMIIWIWVRMATARWNPDEFKKAWMHLVYLIVGLFLVFAAWWIVNLVAVTTPKIFLN